MKATVTGRRFFHGGDSFVSGSRFTKSLGFEIHAFSADFL